jgi:AcrR family transcriptional regulator
MENPMTTQDKLLLNARRLFWSRGYSNVSVRQIASAAGVDVALISRYFGGQLGLFTATLDGAFEWGELAALDKDTLVDAFLKIFAEIPRGGDEPSAIRMILTNAHDEEVADLVRRTFQSEFHEQIAKITKSDERAALFIAVLFGVSVAEKSLHLPGIAKPDSQKYQSQLRHLMRAALDFPQDDGA